MMTRESCYEAKGLLCVHLVRCSASVIAPLASDSVSQLLYLSLRVEV